MAISAQQIRDVLAKNPNASQAQIEKAMAKYGVTPREFLIATGVDPANYAGNTRAADEVYTPVYTPPTPTPAPTPAPAPVTPTPTPAPAPAPAPAQVTQQTTATQPTGPSDDQIRAAVRAITEQYGMTPSGYERLIKAMGNYGVSPERLAGVIGASADTVRGYINDYNNNTGIFATPTPTPTSTPISQQATASTPAPVSPTQAQPPSGAALTGQPQYSNDVINNVLRERFLESGPLSAEDVNRAGIRYGISPQQMASIDPRLMEQTAGLAPARETLADVSQGLRGDYATAQQFQAPYREYGQEAAQRQAALTGALGPEAQQQAFAEYQASPALGFLQEQSERALMRNAAAMGGLGGGNVRQDLTKLTADLYSQDFQNQFNRLGDIATRGYGAAATSAGLGQNLATGAANLGATGAGYQMQAGRDISNAQGQTAANMANLQTALGTTQANNLTNLQNQQLGAYNLGGQYGSSAANQYLAMQNALQGIGNAYAGVPGQTYTPVPSYDLGTALQRGGQAYDLATSMFSGQPQNPTGYQFGGKTIPSGGNIGSGIDYGIMYG